MKTRNLFALSAFLLGGLALSAENAKQTVSQVKESVTVSEDVDYIITGQTPFGAMGSVNIQNTEHAVVILKAVRPSQVIKDLLKDHVFIQGEQAVDGTNCQVKMYNTGAIILPYDKNFRPLTCYTEPNFKGSSCQNYTEGSAGGFMKTLTTSTLNNKIRSFKLKRGYMVTFAMGTGGWGYSRCFIADKEDLEIASMPAPFDQRASSYRLFRWNDAAKKGLASDGRYEANYALHTSWCYDWGTGNASLLPDVEWVPNHIYEDWPSASACGSVTGSCHMKTNNEPGNSADDHPQDVATVLGNWQNLMRTGMRLCSESSHDGSWGHLRAFIDSIDARGWRCDLLDLHCYWNEWAFDNLSNYYRDYGGRPIWISEWVWGASWNGSNWNNGGIFAQAPDGKGSFSQKNQQLNYDHVKPILEKLNANPHIERYAYWNSEANASKIYLDGKLSILGEYYAKMDAGIGYDRQYEKVPNIVCFDPGNLTGTYNKTRKTFKLDWTDPNGDMLSSMELQCKAPGSSLWKTISQVALKDKTSQEDVAYTYTDTLDAPGLYLYRIYTLDAKHQKHYSSEASVTVSAANNVGTLGYGSLDIGSLDEVTTEFETRNDPMGEPAVPAVFTGMCSNKNTANGLSNHLLSVTKTSFRFRLNPWQLKSPVNIDKTESVDYMLVPLGTYQLGEESQMLVGQVGTVKGDTLEVAFPTPFPEGTTPVVVVQNSSSSKTAAPVVARAFHVTNTGFKVVLTRQAGVTGSFTGQKTNYMAALPGSYKIGQGRLLTVYRDTTTPVGGSTYVSINLRDANGAPLHSVNPCIVGAAQTFNHPATCVFRQQSVGSEDFTLGEETYSGLTAIRVKRQMDETTTSTEKNTKTNGDLMGWFILSTDLLATGDEPLVFNDPTPIRSILTETLTVSVHNGRIQASDRSARAYRLNGQQVSLDTPLPAGIYVVTNGAQSLKVQVR